MLDEHPQQRHLAASHGHFPPRLIGQAKRRCIEGPFPERGDAPARRTARVPRPPQDDFDPGEELAKTVRLAEVVLGAQLEPENAIGFIDA